MRNTGEGAVYENTRLTSWIVSGGVENEKLLGRVLYMRIQG